MRKADSYRHARRAAWRIEYQATGTPWVSTYKGEVKRRYVVRQGKTYEPNGVRECQRRAGKSA